MHRIYFIILLIALSSCSDNHYKQNTISTEENARELNKGERILDSAIRSHGVKQILNQPFKFIFRNQNYQVLQSDDQFNYQYAGIDKDEDSLKVHVSNQKVEVWKNGNLLILNDSVQIKYADDVNSVIYFATLPLKLQDEAVIANYIAEIKIKEKWYHAIKISFKPINGGTDFDDKFMYWIEKKSYTVDYLAYRYHTNGGGVRFRQAFNRRELNGVLFQDYMNYKAPVTTSLTVLPVLFEKDSLEKLSVIQTEKITWL